VHPRDIAFAARGRVVVRSGGREVGSARLRDGRVVVRLDRLDRTGKHVLRVRHVGNRLVRPSSASTTVVVGRR